MKEIIDQVEELVLTPSEIELQTKIWKRQIRLTMDNLEIIKLQRKLNKPYELIHWYDTKEVLEELCKRYNFYKNLIKKVPKTKSTYQPILDHLENIIFTIDFDNYWVRACL